MRKFRDWVVVCAKALFQDPTVVKFVLLPLCLLAGAGLMRWGQVAFGDKTGARPTSGDKSLQDQTGALAASLTDRANQAMAEVTSQYQAKTTGEVLCFLAESGHEETVKYLLDRGQSVNSLDRNGRTPLMHAAYGGHPTIVRMLLAQKDVQVNQQDDYGDNAYIHALANERAATVLPALTAAGVRFPTFDQTPADGQALAEPAEIKPDDVQDWSALLAWINTESANKEDTIAQNNATLIKAIQTIDCGEQVNEPEVQDAAQAERRKLCLLLVNRIIGSRSRVVTLYERDKYRHTKLPKAVVDQVKVLRAVSSGTSQPAENSKAYATGSVMATRRLNAMMLHWMLGKALRNPLDVEFPTREEEEAAAQAAKEKAEREAREEAERAAAAMAYQRPRWTAEAVTEADVAGKSAEDLRDMVWEIYAAAETRFKRDDLNMRFRGKGYKQTFDEPQLNAVQRENVAKLRQLRSTLEGQSTSPNP